MLLKSDSLKLIDLYSVKFLYPLAFIIFNIAYWTYYLSSYYQIE